MDAHHQVLHTQTKPAMQMAHQLLAMKGSRITGRICAVVAAVSFIGYASGATHQLAIAIPCATLALVLLSPKAFKQ